MGEGAESGGTEDAGDQGWGRTGATRGGPAFTESLPGAGTAQPPAWIPFRPLPQQPPQAHNYYYHAVLQVRK